MSAIYEMKDANDYYHDLYDKLLALYGIIK